MCPKQEIWQNATKIMCYTLCCNFLEIKYFNKCKFNKIYFLTEYRIKAIDGFSNKPLKHNYNTMKKYIHSIF